MNDGPEQLAQSGWQATQDPVALKLLEGQDVTHFPLDANWLLGQVRQEVDDPTHVVHDESQAKPDEGQVSIEQILSNYRYVRIHVRLSWGEMNVPAGQPLTQFPWERTKPGKQPVHCNWLTVEATLKPVISHAVHLAPQAVKIFLAQKISVCCGSLTIAFMLIVVGDEIRSFTNATGICRNTMSVEQVLSSGANNAIIGSTCCTRFASRRACSAIGSSAEAAVWTDRAGGSHRWDGIALGIVVRVLGKPCLAGNASPSPVRTLGASEFAY